MRTGEEGYAKDYEKMENVAKLDLEMIAREKAKVHEKIKRIKW